MNINRSLTTAGICMLLSSTSWAIDLDEHSAHHTSAASSVSKLTAGDTKTYSKSESKAQDTMSQESMEKMDNQMKAMNEMHEKMMHAKTPEAKKALAHEQMKMMQEGMSMMKQMSSKPDEKAMPDMMQKKMDMMQMMMESMMDHMETCMSK